MEATRFEEANDCFIDAMRKDEFSLYFVDYYSACLWMLGKSNELSILVNNCTKIDPTDKITWIVKANLHSVRGEKAQSIQMLEKAVEADKKHSYSYCLMGHEYFVNENLMKAKEKYNEAVVWDRRNYRALAGLGRVSLRMRYIDSAVSYAKRAKQINPFAASLCYLLSDAYIQANLSQESLKTLLEFEQIASIGEKKVIVEKKGDIYFELNQFREAKACYEELISLAPESIDPLVLERLGLILKHDGDLAEARKILRQAILTHPTEKTLIRATLKEIYDQEKHNNIMEYTVENQPKLEYNLI